MSEWEERARILRARQHECQRRETAMGEWDEEWKNQKRKHRSSSLNQSTRQSVSQSVQSVDQSAGKQAQALQTSKQSQPASQQASPFFASTKGSPPWECPPCSRSRQITNRLPQKRSGGRRTVEGGRVENRGSRIDKPAPWRPTPRARYERELNSIEQKPMAHVRIKGGID